MWRDATHTSVTLLASNSMQNLLQPVRTLPKKKKKSVPANLLDIKLRMYILQILHFYPEARPDHKLSTNKSLY
jgi:hypothetical protein